MNRTLRRPMFRIGGSAGTGITSGLDMPRVSYQDGTQPNPKRTFAENLKDNALKIMLEGARARGQFGKDPEKTLLPQMSTLDLPQLKNVTEDTTEDQEPALFKSNLSDLSFKDRVKKATEDQMALFEELAPTKESPLAAGTLPGFLVQTGLNLTSATPRGRGIRGAITTAADAAKGPFTEFQKGVAARNVRDAKLKQAILSEAITAEREKDTAELEFAKEFALEQLKKNVDSDNFVILTPEEAQKELGGAYNPKAIYQKNLKDNKITVSVSGLPKEIIKETVDFYKKGRDEEAAKTDTKKINEAETGYLNSVKLSQTIDVLSYLANTPAGELETGTLGPLRLSATKLLNEIGIDVDFQNVPLAELLNAVGGKVAVDALQGFRGAISNRELDFVINRNPGLSTSKEGIKLQLALLSRANDISSRYYTEVVAPFVDENDGLKGTLNGKSFRQLQVEFYQNNPLYTKEIEDKIDSLQGQIDPEYQDNVIVKDGKKFLVLPTLKEVIPLDE